MRCERIALPTEPYPHGRFTNSIIINTQKKCKHNYINRFTNFNCYGKIFFTWRHGSAGRAFASHARGHRFESCCLHHILPIRTGGGLVFFGEFFSQNINDFIVFQRKGTIFHILKLCNPIYARITVSIHIYLNCSEFYCLSSRRFSTDKSLCQRHKSLVILLQKLSQI